MNQRPVSVLVISILCIIYGGLIFLLTAFSLVANAFHLTRSNPLIQELERDTFYKVINYSSGCIGIILAIMVLAGSIGSLMLKNWARITMLVWAVLSMINTVIGTILAMVYVVPLMTKTMAAADPTTARIALVGGYIGGACGAALYFILPILVLVFFTRQKVVNAFHGIFEASPTNFPVDPAQPAQF